MIKYSAVEIEEHLKTLTNWTHEGKYIVKNFVFRDFSEAFAFLTRVALISESMDHHAEWSGVYNKVTLKLSTHVAGGITSKDFTFAQKVEKLLK
ncbi:MAG: 4a-hydroxytetrahydrobiopterin dehydratase [Saprospiraceae bacterium]